MRHIEQIARILFAALCLGVPPAGRLAAQRAPVAQPRRVVFVCEHGTVKSLVALEYFNRLARARGLDVVAVSRGTRPDTAVPQVVRAGLAGDGFDVARFHPRAFSASDLASAILVVTLDAEIGSIAEPSARISHWDGLPSVTSNYAKGRSAIVERVGALVDSLARTRTTKR